MGGAMRVGCLRHCSVSGTPQREAEPDHRRALRLRSMGGAGKGAPSAVRGGVAWGGRALCGRQGREGEERRKARDKVWKSV